MLKCREVTRESGDYIEHAMPWHRALQMKFHLLMCRHCRRFVDHLSTAISYFHKFPVDELPGEQAREIAVAVREKAQSRKEDGSP